MAAVSFNPVAMPQRSPATQDAKRSGAPVPRTARTHDEQRRQHERRGRPFVHRRSDLAQARRAGEPDQQDRDQHETLALDAEIGRRPAREAKEEVQRETEGNAHQEHDDERGQARVDQREERQVEQRVVVRLDLRRRVIPVQAPVEPGPRVVEVVVAQIPVGVDTPHQRGDAAEQQCHSDAAKRTAVECLQEGIARHRPCGAHARCALADAPASIHTSPPDRDGRAMPDHAPHNVELTILMPCLDEAETLGRCIDAARDFLARARIDGEIVVADNGSTDGSIEIAAAARRACRAGADPRLRRGADRGTSRSARPLRDHGRLRRQLRFRASASLRRAPARRAAIS